MNTYTEETWPAAIGNAFVGAISKIIANIAKLVWRNPLNALGLCVLGTGTVFGVANALWLQPAHHPAPFFMETAAIAKPLVATPQEQAVPQPLLVRPEQVPATGIVSAVPSPRSQAVVETPVVVIGNKDVAILQEKLAAIGLFAGKVDGYYGPETANAIRAFEQKTGMVAKGALSQEILDAVAGFVVATPVAPMPVAVAPIPVSKVAMPAPALRRVTSAPVTITPVASAPATQTAVPQAPQVEVLDNIAKIALSATPDEPLTIKASTPAVLDTNLIRRVQTGLVRLGFLNTEINGKFDAETARAIREFENYNNYERTGQLSPELIDLLRTANAFE